MAFGDVLFGEAGDSGGDVVSAVVVVHGDLLLLLEGGGVAVVGFSADNLVLGAGRVEKRWPGYGGH